MAARWTTGKHTIAHRLRAVVVACIGLVLGAVASFHLSGLAQVAPRIKELDLSPRPEPGSCDAALTVGYAAFQRLRDGWAAASSSGRLLPDFGRSAGVAEEKALAAFDGCEGAGSCVSQRKALMASIRKEVWSMVLTQRQLTERVVTDDLSAKLLRGMGRRGGPLRVKEKIDLMRSAASSYRQSLQSLLPVWADKPSEDELAEVERRLGTIQFRIEESEEGRALGNRWDQNRMQRLMSRRAHGFSVSVDPGLRLMLRPEGLGNLQIFSVGPVGPPNQPATVNIGILNDGSIADVYREHPVPPKVAMQPALKFNLNLR